MTMAVISQEEDDSFDNNDVVGDNYDDDKWEVPGWQKVVSQIWEIIGYNKLIIC